MTYYRAALAAAKTGDLSQAERLCKCSLLLNENAPNAERLAALLSGQNTIAPETLNSLRVLVDARKYKKALKLNLPRNSKALTVRGLIFAILGRENRAREEFAAALELDSGNEQAKRALEHCRRKKRWFFL